LELSERQMAEKRPHWTTETVLRKIPVVFPESDPAQILAVLDSAVPDGDGPRVQLAIMKLCDARKGLADLTHYVKAAKVDYRDVLAWAEYPNGIGLPLSAGDPKREDAGRRDHEQYLRWIEWIGIKRRMPHFAANLHFPLHGAAAPRALRGGGAAPGIGVWRTEDHWH
jgi:hypothetical protein